MDKILHWADRFGDLPVEALAASSPGEPPSGEIVAKPKALARINQGRWIVDCPFCTGAELLEPETNTFFCCSCRNAETGHASLRVQVPDAGARGLIESYLVEHRPLKARNWEPGETVEDLKRQDAEARVMGLMS